MSKSVLVYGGCGALGRVIVDTFKVATYKVISVDLIANEAADSNIVLDSNSSIIDQSSNVCIELAKLLGDVKLDAILCVAGGWAGGNASSNEFIKNTNAMMCQSINSSVIAAHVSAKYLLPGGLLQLTGAMAALDATPGMIGYGMAKAAVHHLVKSLAAPNGGLPEGASVVAILPVTLDTPMNRKFMANADFSSWTPLDEVATRMLAWSNGEMRPSSGALVNVVTAGGKTSWEQV